MPAVVVTARRAAPVGLTRAHQGSDALVAISHECIEHWRANVTGVVQERDAESLHQLRVGVRRLRSAFSLFRRTLGSPGQMQWLGSEIREAALPFGRARDLDVLLGCGQSSDPSQDLTRDLTASQCEGLHALREKAYDDCIAVLCSAAWEDLWEHLARFLSHAPWGLDPDPDASTVAMAALERRWRRVGRRGDRLDALSPKERHALRIEAKKLRYGAQFFAGLYPDTTSTPPLRFADTVAGLQDALGAMTDLAMARRVLAQVQARPVDVDEDALLAGAVTAYEAVAALEPFWHRPS